jgi:hypothetical protein
MSPVRLIAMLCAAQVLVQIGAFFWPALLPEMIARWSLTNSEAGWITAAFYGAYMLAVPILVTLTDRIDAKRVYHPASRSSAVPSELPFSSLQAHLPFLLRTKDSNRRSRNSLRQMARTPPTKSDKRKSRLYSWGHRAASATDYPHS